MRQEGYEHNLRGKIFYLRSLAFIRGYSLPAFSAVFGITMAETGSASRCPFAKVSASSVCNLPAGVLVLRITSSRCGNGRSGCGLIARMSVSATQRADSQGVGVLNCAP